MRVSLQFLEWQRWSSGAACPNSMVGHELQKQSADESAGEVSIEYQQQKLMPALTTGAWAA